MIKERHQKSTKRVENYEWSKKIKECDMLFINLNKKKDFNEDDIFKIKIKFIEHVIISCLSKVSSYILKNIFKVIFFFFIVLSILSGKFNTVDILVSVIFACIIKLLFNVWFKELNNYATLSILDNKISMVFIKDLEELDNKSVERLLASKYFDALEKALDKNTRPVKFSTHELIRLKVCNFYEDNPNYNFKCVFKGMKPIKEFMVVKPLKHLINLYKHIDINEIKSEEFREVTRLLRAHYTWDIQISKRY